MNPILADVKDFTEIMDHIVVSVAAMIGGLWVLFRFWRERTDEAALKLTVKQRSSPFGNNHLVAFLVKLENKGKTKIQAKTGKTQSGFAFDDGIEKLQSACSLQIKKLAAVTPPMMGRVDWFENPPEEPVAGLAPEINLLIEYEDPKNQNIVDFWLEPGEVYDLEMPVILPSGVYLAKVTFVAEGGDCNFWSRVFSFAVPISQEKEQK